MEMIILVVFTCFFLNVRTEYSWEHLQGSQLGSCVGVYGTSFSTSNYPGSRRGQISWYFPGTNSSYLLGGYGCTDSTLVGLLSDVWEVKQDESSGELLWKFIRRLYSSYDNLDLNEYSVRTSSYGVNNFLSTRYGASVNVLEDTDEVVIFGGFGYATYSRRRSGGRRPMDYDGYLQDVWFLRMSDFYGKELTGYTHRDRTGAGSYRASFAAYSSCRPCGRYYHSTWVNEDEDYLILFGGYGIGTGTNGYLNSMYIIRLSDSYVKWQNGETSSGQEGNIESMNDYDVDNCPGARAYSIHWRSGNTGYLYGGKGRDAANQGAGIIELTDFWALDLNSYEFKRLTSTYDFYHSYTGNSGFIEKEEIIYGSSSLFPKTYLSSFFYKQNSDTLFFYGGESNGDYLSFLYEIHMDNFEDEIEFRYLRFGSGGGLHDYDNPKNSDSLDANPSYTEITESFDDHAFPGSSEQGSFIYIDGIDMILFSPGESGASQIRSNDIWHLKEYVWECNGDETSDAFAENNGCSGPNCGICQLNWTCECTNGYSSPVTFKCWNWYCYDYHYLNDLACSDHGECIKPNNCSCDLNWGGEECEELLNVCWNFSYYDSDTCSAHGDCMSMNNCSCENNYFGERCQVHQCFGHWNNDTLNNNLCSSRGDCVGHNNCSCEDGYFGNYCQNTTCFEESQYSDIVCSGHGECSSLDNCSCDSYYTDNECQTHVCYGYKFNNLSHVCHANGECIGPNDCSCYVNFSGSDCKFCNRSFCNNHGDCSVGLDYPWIASCECDSLFTDDFCQNHKCYEFAYYNTSYVCHQKGDCVGPGECSCFANFSGPDCQFCNRSFCNNHGDCELEEYYPWTARCTCDNDGDYIGEFCDIEACYGYAADDDSYTCHQNGDCLGPNECDCYDEYTGYECQFCNRSFCSSHGECYVGSNYPWENACLCDDHYSNPEEYCDVWQCFGTSKKLGNDVCFGHGECIDYNNCTCEDHYYGDNCDEFSCFEISNHPNFTELICSGNGNCENYDDCVCFNELYFGEKCENYNCSGFNNTDPSTCSSHGECINPEICECQNLTTGGYYGKDCEIEISFIAYFKGIAMIRIDYEMSLSHIPTDVFFVSSGRRRFSCFGDYEYGLYPNILAKTFNNYEKLGLVTAKYDSTKNETVYEIDEFGVMDQDCFWKVGSPEDEISGDKRREETEDDRVIHLDIALRENHKFEVGDNLEVKTLTGSENITVRINGSKAADPEDDPDTPVPDDDQGENDGDQDNNESFDAMNILYGVVGFFLLGFAVVAYLGVFCILCCGLLLICFVSCFLTQGIGLFNFGGGMCCCCYYGDRKNRSRRRKTDKERYLQNAVFGDGIDSKYERFMKNKKDYFKGKGKKGKGGKGGLEGFSRARASMNFNLDLFRIQEKDIQLIKLIGSGGSASNIYLAKWKKSQQVAVKVFRTPKLFVHDQELDDMKKKKKKKEEFEMKETNYDFEEFERELTILGSISHPFIIQLYGVCLHPPKVALVMEFCAHGDLRTYFLKCKLEKKSFFDHQFKMLFIFHVCSALEYLHSRKIIHRDMKSDNILLTKELTPKLIDFGVSKVFVEHNKLQTKRIGTSQYMAPEVVRGKYDQKCDIYSLSIIIYELLMENFDPYSSILQSKNNQNYNFTSPIEYLVEKDPNFRPIIPKEFNQKYPKFAELMTKMWDHDPSNRPEVEEVKNYFEYVLENPKKEPKESRNKKGNGGFLNSKCKFEEELEDLGPSPNFFYQLEFKSSVVINTDGKERESDDEEEEEEIVLKRRKERIRNMVDISSRDKDEEEEGEEKEECDVMMDISTTSEGSTELKPLRIKKKKRKKITMGMDGDDDEEEEDMEMEFGSFDREGTRNMGFGTIDENNNLIL